MLKRIYLGEYTVKKFSGYRHCYLYLVQSEDSVYVNVFDRATGNPSKDRFDLTNILTDEDVNFVKKAFKELKENLDKEKQVKEV